MLREGSFQNNCDDLDDMREKLEAIQDSRDQANRDCNDTSENELSILQESQEFKIKRDDIDGDITILTESLDCDDSVIAVYFQCHIDRVSTLSCKHV